ncbi:MAG: hypothetical protein QM737_23615 [Ferruginibacter sp.]
MFSVFKKIALPFLILLAGLTLNSCHKNADLSPVTPVIPNQPPDLSTKIITSVSGFVINENDQPVGGAMVKFGISTATTDNTGYFKIENAEVVKAAAVVTVSMTGYFKNIKTYAVTEGKQNLLRIKLIPKTEAGTISSTAGGNITLTNGLTISFPADAIMVASSGTSYNGTVHVAASWLNPEANDLGQTMPGDLRAIDENGNLTGLRTYGMAAVELTGDAGELLQLSAGKKATLTFPLSPVISPNAPSSIPLWYFDEEKGLWKQEGTATKTGNNYIGDVTHFSYWNCDLPCAIVPLTFTVVDQNGNGQGGVYVVITPHVTDPCSRVFGTTDATGYVSVFVTPNTQYDMFLYESCGSGMVNIHTFTAGTTAIDLGNIAAAGTVSSLATITGTVSDCNGNPVTYGAVLVGSTFYPVDNTGHFSYSHLLGCNNADLIFIGYDYNSFLNGTPTWHHISPGMNDIGNLPACGNNINQRINCTIDGVNHMYQIPTDTLSHTEANNYSAIWALAGANYINFDFIRTGIAMNSIQVCDHFVCPQFESGGPIDVLITEPGSAMGEYVAGSFNGTIVDLNGISHTVAVDFRVAY